MEQELIAKAKEAKTVEELMAFSKENGAGITEEDAKMYFEVLHPKTGELSDEELDNVAGGGCYTQDGYLLTTIGHKCKFYEEILANPQGVKGTCCRCKYWDHRDRNGYEEVGRPVRCFNPNNIRRS